MNYVQNAFCERNRNTERDFEHIEHMFFFEHIDITVWYMQL